MSDAGKLEIKNVYAAYDSANVLEGVSLTAEPGKITCLLGSNGAGKSTLIRTILGLTPPHTGEILIDGVNLVGAQTHKIISAGISCIPEGRKVFPKMTVVENLRLGGFQEKSEVIIKQRMEEVFDIFPRLAERKTQLAGTMSGGEQAMVSIGRSMMSAPKVLLIDEPSLGLSPLFVKENFNTIKRINEKGTTIFLVEQNVHQTLAIAHYGYVLSQGHVVAQGTAAELINNTEVREAYFG